MTETMKKFKPPFKVIYIHECSVVSDNTSRIISEHTHSEDAAIVADALNFYYAKKGEKE